MMSYIILGNNRLCRFSTKKGPKILWCRIDFLIICNFFLVQAFFDQVPNKGSAWSIHVRLGPKWKNPGSYIRVPNQGSWYWWRKSHSLWILWRAPNIYRRGSAVVQWLEPKVGMWAELICRWATLWCCMACYMLIKNRRNVT